jgi:hypothetical protein
MVVFQEPPKQPRLRLQTRKVPCCAHLPYYASYESKRLAYARKQSCFQSSDASPPRSDTEESAVLVETTIETLLLPPACSLLQTTAADPWTLPACLPHHEPWKVYVTRGDVQTHRLLLGPRAGRVLLSPCSCFTYLLGGLVWSHYLFPTAFPVTTSRIIVAKHRLRGWSTVGREAQRDEH